MSFDYEKYKAREEEGNWWTSYADLFTMMSAVFLMLYVVSSLKTGTQGVQQQVQYAKAVGRVQELEQQLKVYTTLKDDYLNNSASEDEQKVYENLMSHLSLLQDQAKQEKEELRKAANENEKKEVALNQYQQIIRNIVNANLLAKSQINRRDQVIVQNTAEIKEKSGQIANLTEDVKSKEQSLEQAEREAAALEQKLIAQRQAQQQKLAAFRKDTEAKLSAERKAFQAQLEREKMSAAERARRLAAFKAQAEKERARLSSQMAGLEKQVKATESQIANLQGNIASKEAALANTRGALAEAEKTAGRALASVQNLEKEKAQLSGDLAKAKAQMDMRRNIAAQIKQNFASKGIDANVDTKTGEVVLSFGDEYFASGAHRLTPGMVKKLNSFMPEYAKSLFGDPKLAKQIATVEMIGFASPTFKGKYVDPSSLDPKDQEAVNYNLKLSFNRANEIFRHAFDSSKLKFDYQKEMLSRVKVSGRGFLPEGKSGKDIPPGLPEKEFCKQFNCERAQRVIIKFNLKD